MTFTLQLLHASDLEGGVDAIERAPNFAAVMDALDDAYANTLKLSAGDNYIPSPFFNAQNSAEFAGVLEAAYTRWITEVLIAEPDATQEEIDALSALSFSLDPLAGSGDMAIMNIIGFDASALGNHEFDAGPDQLAAIIGQAVDGDAVTNVGALFPYLSANLDFSGEPALDALFTDAFQSADAFSPEASDFGAATAGIAPSTFVEVGGERIAVIGATTQLLETISSTGGVDETTGGANDMTALAAVLQARIDAALADGAGDINKVVVVSHLQQIALETELAGLLTGVDIIVAGGSDTLLADATDTLRDGDVAADTYPRIVDSADDKPVAIVSTDGEYSYVGRLVVEFDDDGVIIPTSIDAAVSGAYATDEAGVLAVTGAATLEDALTAGAAGGSVAADIVEDITASLYDLAIVAKEETTFAEHTVFLDGERASVRTEETNLGNLTADANLAAAQAVDPTVLISFKNGGGIRAAIEVEDGSEGEISQLDIENSLRFDNKLATTTLTAAGLLMILEHAVADTDTAAGNTPGRFPQIGGLRFSFDEGQDAQVLATDGEGDYVIDAATGMPAVESAGARIRDIAVIGADGAEMVIFRDGAFTGDPAETFGIVTLNFLAAGGDGYPFPELAQTPVKVITIAGTLVDEAQDSELLGEQAALADYLEAEFADAPVDTPETSPNLDTRIVQLARGGTFELIEEDAAFQVSKTQVFDAFPDGDEEGGSEVVVFEDGLVYSTNGAADRIDVFRAATGELLRSIDVAGAVADYDGLQSVAVHGGVVAVAVARDVAATGVVALFDETGAKVAEHVVGALPDMVTFTPDGSKILVAGEGEPQALNDDPLGTVSVIDVATGTVHVLDFTAFDAQQEALIAAGLAMDPRNTLSADLEPEYIAVAPDGQSAWVTLQEANAFAVVDLSGAAPAITEIIPGFVSDRSLEGNEIDPSNRDDGINLALYDNLFGLSQPDAVTAHEIDGATYYFTANEGDGREYEFDNDPDAEDGGLFNSEVRIKDVALDEDAFGGAEAVAALQENEALGRLKIRADLGDIDGDGDYDRLYHYGSRSFTIYAADGSVVWDSGSEFSRIVAQFRPELFNHDEEEFDGRSDDKGVEPEAVAVGEVEGETYAFIGLERDGGIMVYRVSDPTAPEFVKYIDSGADGHVSPETINFIPAADSVDGKAQIVVAFEVSGESVLYTLDDLSKIEDGDELPVENVDFAAADGVIAAGTAEEIAAAAGEDGFQGFGEDGFFFEGDAASPFSFDRETGQVSFGDTSFSVSGFGAGNFLLAREADGTRVQFVREIVEVREGVAVDVEDINGIAFDDFLRGDGTTDFVATVDSLNGGAAFANKIGVYEVTAAGEIVDIRVMFQDAKDVSGGERFRVTDVEAGNSVGFFLVQDGATALGDVADEDLDFVFDDGGVAALQVLGEEAGVPTFHSFAAAWNADGVAHVLSGASAEDTLRVGFEDLSGWGDRDFEDFVFNVAREQMLAEI